MDAIDLHRKARLRELIRTRYKDVRLAGLVDDSANSPLFKQG